MPTYELSYLDNSESDLRTDSISMYLSSEYSETPSLVSKGGKVAQTRNFFGSLAAFLWEGPRVPTDSPPSAREGPSRFANFAQRFHQRFSWHQRALGISIYLFLWSIIWAQMLLPYLQNAPTLSNGAHVMTLSCQDAFWRGKNDACGLNAAKCEPNEDIIFRCPALCDRGSWLYSSRAVGSSNVKYRGFFIGGGKIKDRSEKVSQLSKPYRADSFPCGAAVHSGLISPFSGGCARISYTSALSNFPSTKGFYGVSDSIPFRSFFPFAYFFTPLPEHISNCHDPRLAVLLLNIVMGIPIMVLGSGSTIYWTMAIVGFWTIVLATDPPIDVDPQVPETFYSLISVGLERFLPTCFVLYVLWVTSVKRTFSSLETRSYMPFVQEYSTTSGHPFSPMDIPRPNSARWYATILWYPLFWLGILNNMTFDRLPVDRLTWHDLQTQPGALVTVAAVASVLVVCILCQGFYVWRSGRFWKLLAMYGLIFSSFIILANLQGLTLRIHHYIFALVFIPGCSTRGKTALMFQGILLGLFLSGVSRWGFASIAETNLSLLRGEPSGQLPPPAITSVAGGVLLWSQNATQATVDSKDSGRISLLINDIERFNGENNGAFDLGDYINKNEELCALATMENSTQLYIRLAKYPDGGKEHGDYTQAAIVEYPSFEFQLPPPGIT